MTHPDTITYILDALGGFGLIVGGYVASKSTYARQNSRDAAMLIDTQAKRIDVLIEQQKADHQDRERMQAQLNTLQGQLKTYQELSLVSPDIIAKLLDTQNAILKVLTSDGIKISVNSTDEGA